MKQQVLPTRRYHRRADDLTRIPPRPTKRFKVSSFALASRQLNWTVDTAKKFAAREGVNQSAIVRAAIDLLAAHFADRDDDEFVRYIRACAEDGRDLMGPSPRSET